MRRLQRKLRGSLESGNYEIVYQDEVHFQLNTTIAAKWIRKGFRPRVKSAPGRKKASYGGYVLPSTGELFVTRPRWFNFETLMKSYREFLAKFEIADERKILMVTDNAPWHRKAKHLIWDEQKAEYADIRERMEVLSLPPYSPDLNPIEQVWRKTRRDVTHNRYFKDMPELENALTSYFDGFGKPNRELTSLCTFKHKYL